MENVNESAVSVIASIMDTIKQFNTVAANSKAKSKEGRALGNKENGSKLTSSSILRASKDLVMSFPVICSNSISPETALLLQKSIERICTTQLRMIFASAYLKGDNGVQVIKKWHNNIETQLSMDDYFDYIDAAGAVADKALDKFYFRENAASFREADKFAAEMVAECKRSMTFYPESSFSESSICGFEIGQKYNGDVDVRYFNEGKNNNNGSFGKFQNQAAYYYYNQGMPSYDKKGKFVGYKTQAMIDNDMKAIELDIEKKKVNSQSLKNLRDYKVKKAEQENKAKELENQAQQIDTKNKNDEERNKIARDTLDQQIKQDQLTNQINIAKLQSQDLNSKQELFQKQLLDTDIKKANEAVPTLMIIRYAVAGATTDQYEVNQEFVAGVKARLIGCDSAEIIDRIRLATENKIDIKNFVRATTGEIKFMKDFVLAIDQAKIEAQRNSKLSRTSPIWRALQKRSTKSVMNRLKRGKANDAGAITSVVITTDECNFLKNQFNIDLTNVKVCRSIMESYNFMMFIIVDEAIEMAHFLLDNEDAYFQEYSFTALRKETDGASGKEVVNLLSTINRG